MPEVREGQIIQAEKLQRRGSRGELVNIDKNEIVYNSLTAGQLDDIIQQAYEDVRQQAHEEGSKAGYQAGLQQGQQTIQQHAQQLNEAISSLFQFLQGQDDDIEQALVNLSTLIARSILRRELSLDSTHIQQVVQDAIAALPLKSDNVTIFLSEQDYRYIKEQTTVPDTWRLQLDQTLKPGGCRVITQNNIVDYTLDEQFQQTINTLVEERFAQLAAHSRAADDDNSGQGS